VVTLSRGMARGSSAWKGRAMRDRFNAFVPHVDVVTQAPPLGRSPVDSVAKFHLSATWHKIGGSGRWCTRRMEGEMTPPWTSYVMTAWLRTDLGRPAASIRFRTATSLANGSRAICASAVAAHDVSGARTMPQVAECRGWNAPPCTFCAGKPPAGICAGALAERPVPTATVASLLAMTELN
jgi:hypothetical protein